MNMRTTRQPIFSSGAPYFLAIVASLAAGMVAVANGWAATTLFAALWVLSFPAVWIGLLIVAAIAMSVWNGRTGPYDEVPNNDTQWLFPAGLIAGAFLAILLLR